jgi:hypothetical protein
VAEEALSGGVAQCNHHWLIEPADRKKSKGVCKLCGAVREFLNDPGDRFSIAAKTEPMRVYFPNY